MIRDRSIDARISSPVSLRCGDARLLEGVGMVAVGVRMFLIAIAVLAVGAVAFLIVTA